jgi:hypothetical protein
MTQTSRFWTTPNGGLKPIVSHKMKIDPTFTGNFESGISGQAPQSYCISGKFIQPHGRIILSKIAHDGVAIGAALTLSLTPINSSQYCQTIYPKHFIPELKSLDSSHSLNSPGMDYGTLQDGLSGISLLLDSQQTKDWSFADSLSGAQLVSGKNCEVQSYYYTGSFKN